MKKILFSVLLTILAVNLHSQDSFWKQTHGPYGSGEWGGQLSLANGYNGKIYAHNNSVSGRKLYASSDDGNHWNELEYLYSNDSIRFESFFVGQAGNFYALNTDNFWEISSDEGMSWTPLFGNIYFSELVETPTGALIGWDQVYNKIYRSTNQGHNWNLVASMPYMDVANGHAEWKASPFGTLFAEVHQNDLDPEINYEYISLDDGQTWARMEIEDKYTLQFVSVTGAMFFKESGQAGILRMDTIGQPLVKVATKSATGFTKLSSGRLLATDNSSVLHYSDDDGLTWYDLTTDAVVTIIQEMEQLPDGSLFAYSKNALSRSTDGGATWQFTGYGISRGKTYKFKALSDSNFVCSTVYGLWNTADAGQNWDLWFETKKDFSYVNNFDVVPSGKTALVYNERLYYTDSLGGNFMDITPPLADLGFNPLVFINPDNDQIFLNCYPNPLISNDAGQSWVTLASLPPSIKKAIFHPSGRIILHSSIAVYYSDDNGQTWTQVNDSDLNSVAVSASAISPSGDIYVALFPWVNGQEGKIAYSQDRGETWTVTGQLTETMNFPFMEITLDNHIYMVDDYENILLSVNKGQSWQKLPCPEDENVSLCTFDVGILTLLPSNRLFVQIQNLFNYITTKPVTHGAFIEGTVRLDADADCSTPDAQDPIPNRILKAEGAAYSSYTNTDANGHYIFFLDTGTYQIILQNPNIVWWNYCADSVSVTLTEFLESDTVDYAVIPLAFCPLMTVNVAIPNLRRCFDNEVYVEYCNQGSVTADSAWVDVMLDPYLSLVSSAQPHEDLGGNLYRFFVGDVFVSDCGQFQLTVHVDCDSTVLGQTHCITAHGFPDTLCTTVPNWSGANIEASVVCQDTTVELHLKNTGNAHSATLDYIIIEDDVVLFSGENDYDIAEDLVLDYPANGKTWRIESEQEPGHPFSNLALAFTEGCGGFNSLGFINQFTVNGIQPSWHRMCVENTGSFDPNDKQGFPTGTGAAHNIRPGQTIDYLIRFQNTGTDTAFAVAVLDTLSAFLDPLSFRPGASSHPYTWSLSGQGVIKFSFNNIMLPDSNVNEPRSHGFVQFSIAPYADVPLGSVIENSAGIYFDFNAPVITNTTWHTIEQSPLSNTYQPLQKTPESGLEVWPNPFSERTNIHVVSKTARALDVKIYNSLGALVSQKSTTGPDIEFNARHLPNGMYWAEVRDSNGNLIGNGKMIKE